MRYNSPMTPLKIAMISYHTSPLASLEGKETGGMNVYVLELSRALAKKGHLVDMYTRRQSLHQAEVIQVAPRLRVIHLTAGLERHLPKKQLINYIPEFTQNYLKFIRSEKITYDLFHAYYYLSGLIALRILEETHISLPLIMSFHTLALMKNLVARNPDEKAGSLRIAAEQQLTREADRIISPSESDRRYLEYLYDTPLEKIAVIPPGVDTAIFKPIAKDTARRRIGASLKHKIITFVGRIEPLKGIDVLMYAMTILLKRRPEMVACLWIVGGDVSQPQMLWSRQLKHLEKLRQTLGISTIVKFVGQRPQVELPDYYNAADIVVMPSHYESFGMAALEAMACGVPVITTNVSGVAGLMDEGSQSLITTVNHPLLLATQMEKLLTDTKFHQHISQQLLAQADKWDWEYVAVRIEKLYRNEIELHQVKRFNQA